MPDAAVRTFERGVCFEQTWWGAHPVRMGQEANLSIHVDGPVTHIWTEDVFAPPPHVARIRSFYSVLSRPAGQIVTWSSGQNMDLRWDPPSQADRFIAAHPEAMRLRVRLPASCTPVIDPATPMKAEMARIRDLSLADYVREARPKARRANLIIVDFNPDDREAFALWLDTGEVLRISLYTFEDPNSPTGGRYGRYRVAEEFHKEVVPGLGRLIRRYGTSRVLSVPAKP